MTTASKATAKFRPVSRVVDALRTTEGDGFTIRRVLPTHGLGEVDPFLLLDHLGPVTLPPGASVGFPDHPHRGFETVSYILQGKLQHRDSHGHAGIIGPGDVQWMTAGSGLVHSEMPEKEFVKKGGVLEGFQIWVNLPRRDKMMAPRYQELAAAAIPSKTEGGVTARVIAGQALGVSAQIDTRVPIVMVHFTVAPGAQVAEALPAGSNGLVYLIRGSAKVGANGASVKEGQIAVFDSQDGGAYLEGTGEEPAEVLLLAGVPLNEPVARYGPFVMNTKAELQDAFEDYRAGKMGVIR